MGAKTVPAAPPPPTNPGHRGGGAIGSTDPRRNVDHRHVASPTVWPRSSAEPGGRLITAGDADPAVRGVPALGHRAPGGQGPEPLGDQFDQTCWPRSRARAPPRRPPPRSTTTVPRATPGRWPWCRPCERPDLPLPAYGDPSPRSRSPASASPAPWSRASRLDQLKRGPGHYPSRPRCPARRATCHRRAPHHLRPAVPQRRQARARRPDHHQTVQGEFVYEIDPRDREAQRGGDPGGQGRQPHHPHRLPPQVLAQASA
jgi:hypothetical protein